MKFALTKKDLIAFNQQFADGTLINEASLDFALSYSQKTENWTKALAWLIRAILLDHVFEEGNKRTAALLLRTYIEFEGNQARNDQITRMIKEIIFRNTTSINKIEEMIKDAIR